MPNAMINYDVDMKHWPPTTYLVHLDTPMVRYDPETGDPEPHEWIALTVQEANPQQAFVFPSNESGEFVDTTMNPMRRKDYGLPHSVLLQLGYTLTN